MKKEKKKTIKDIENIEILARVYKKMHTNDSKEFVLGFLEGLKNAIAILKET